MSEMRLSFHGGAREVTGACHLLEVGGSAAGSAITRILVDCGMFQGCDDCDVRSHAPFPFDPAALDAVFITHAHVDHIGRLPKLVHEGFSGPIYSTPPTRDLSLLLLDDALNFFDSSAPLFGPDDIARALKQWKTVEYHEPIELGSGTGVMLLPAGHILGSAFVRVAAGPSIVLFSGDVGNEPSLLLPPRARVEDVDVLVLESTYGNKTHQHSRDRALLLERAIEDVAARRGTLMLPAFATERTQELLFEINVMMHERRVPQIPVFVDSPLAIRVTEVFSRYPDYYRDEVRKLWEEHQRLFQFKNLRFTPSVAESKAINDVPPPKVIIAGSGMSTGGRILHHERRYLPDPNSMLLVTGFQAAGSLGRRLLDHAREVRIRGDLVPARAEVRVVDGYSAHADENELLALVDEMRDGLERVFVVQGEPAAALGLQQAIQDRLGIPAVAPVYGERFELPSGRG